MRVELAYRFAQGIQLLHLDEQENYTDSTLSSVVGVSTSTLRRHKEVVKMLDIALHLTDNSNDRA